MVGGPRRPGAAHVIRYLVSAFAAVLTLFAILYGISKAVGPGSPAEVLIVGQLELITSRLAGAPEPPERERRPPPRPRTQPPQ